MTKYLLFTVIITIASCTANEDKTNLHFELGMDFVDFYKLVDNGLQKDSILLQKSNSYFIEDGDTIFNNSFANFILYFRTKNQKHAFWSMNPIFYNDKLLSVDLSNPTIDDIENARKILNNYLNLELIKKNKKQDFILEKSKLKGVHLLLIEEKLMNERDSIFNLNYKNILWNEFGDSWTLENQENFKNDLPNERIIRYVR